jgi:hypothetical protein
MVIFLSCCGHGGIASGDGGDVEMFSYKFSEFPYIPL